MNDLFLLLGIPTFIGFLTWPFLYSIMEYESIDLGLLEPEEWILIILLSIMPLINLAAIFMSCFAIIFYIIYIIFKIPVLIYRTIYKTVTGRYNLFIRRLIYLEKNNID